MRRISLVLILGGGLAAVAHLLHALVLSGTAVLDVALGDGSRTPPPFELTTTRSFETYRLRPVALDPVQGPYRASLVLFGSGLRVDYGVALLRPDGETAWLVRGSRRKGGTPSRSTSVLGSFTPEERGLYRFVVALTDRPGIVPSGARLEVRGGVAPVRWEILAGCALGALLGFVLLGRRPRRTGSLPSG
jgi:hypothetical protein